MASVELLFGPLLIGTYMNAILYGVMVVQMFVYFRTYNDGPWMQFFVLFLFVTETVNTGSDIAIMYEPLVLKYGTHDATTFFPLMLAADPITTVLISTPIQIFIAWRIRVISRTIWNALVICILAIISLGGGIWLAITIAHVHRFDEKPDLHWPAVTWLVASAIADLTITVSLAYYLARRKSGFSATDDTINKIIRLTVQTGSITTLFAILDVICFLVLPHTTMNFVWDFALSKLYTNALISTLNARSGWGNLIDGQSPDHAVSLDDAGRQESQFPQFRAYPNAQTLTTGIYELDTTTTATNKTASDVEYDIAILKGDRERDCSAFRYPSQ